MVYHKENIAMMLLETGRCKSDITKMEWKKKFHTNITLKINL